MAPLLDLTADTPPADGPALSDGTRRQLAGQLATQIRRQHPGDEGEQQVLDVLRRWAGPGEVPCGTEPWWHLPGECSAHPRCTS